MPIPSSEIWLAIISVTIVLLILVVGIFFIFFLQQRKILTIQQRNLEKLTESEQRYRRLVKFSPIPMAVIIDGYFVYVNDAWTRLLAAISPEELLKQPLSQFNHPNYVEQAQERLRLVLEEKKEFTFIEEKMVRRDGQIIDVEVTAIPIIYDGKEAVQIVAIDITERKKTEAALIAAKERAEQSDKLKDAFIANISHEIRTPLNVIMGYSNLIRSEFEDRIAEDEEIFFESIKAGGDRLMRTVEHILNISSIQVGTFELRPELIEVNSRIHRFVNDMRPLADAKSLTLEFESELPSAVINVDPYCFDQALTNLMDNAIKFTHEGGVKVTVYRDDQRVCIDITDTGIGISAEYLPKVFSTFSQEVTGYTRPFEGLGLGLALTKRYVEMNNGMVTVKSRKGKGTTFTLQFLAEKVESDDDEDRHVQVTSLEEPPEPVHVEGKMVLVVEDDDQTQQYMDVVLSKEYGIMTADNTTTAWQLIERYNFDLVLMDLSLRGDEDGLDLTRKIRADERFAQMPIIALTAHAFPEDKKRSLEAGCNAYLSKPFQLEELKRLMNELLSPAT